MHNAIETHTPHVPTVDTVEPELTQLETVEALANELKRLLVKHENTLDAEGTRREVEVLERWMESYRRGLLAAHKISETGAGWLVELRDKLKLSADEMLRLEGEGGAPASKEQIAKTEDLLKAVRRIEKVLPNFEQLFPAGGAAAAAADGKDI